MRTLFSGRRSSIDQKSKYKDPKDDPWYYELYPQYTKASVQKQNELLTSTILGGETPAQKFELSPTIAVDFSTGESQRDEED